MSLSKRKALRPVRLIGYVLLLVMPSACAFCIENTIHPAAVEHVDFCARYLNEGKLTEAEARCKLAIEYSPKYAEAYNQLGLIELSRGRQERAVARFKQALAYKDEFAEAHNNLGAIFMEQRQYGPACAEFKEAIEIDPGFVSARVNLGVCHLYSGEASKARNEYLKCLELDPAMCDCRLGLGVLSLNSQEWGEAKSHFEKMTEACPDSAEGLYNLCDARYRLGRCEAPRWPGAAHAPLPGAPERPEHGRAPGPPDPY